jgi:predicted lipoprotein
MRLAAAFLLASVLPAAAQEGAPPPPPPKPAAMRVMVAHAIDDYVIPAYDRLGGAVAKFGDTLEAYCAAPDADGRKALADGFTTLLEGWAGADFIDFGPVTREGRFERFAFWPDPHGTAERQLRRLLAQPDPALLQPGAIAAQSAAIQGLPALEMVLFTGDAALATAEAADPYRCGLAAAIVANLADITATVSAEWRGEDGWRTLMLSPGPDNPVYLDDQQTTTDVLRAILLGLEQLRDERIQPARGPSPEEAKASRAPYWRSGATIAYWRASAAALADYSVDTQLLGLAPPQAAWIAASSAFEFGNLAKALAGVEPPLETALTAHEPRAKLGYALVVLGSLRDIFQSQLPSLSGLTAGFNSLDGD